MIQDRLLKDYGSKLEWNIGSLYAHDRFMWELLDICKKLKIETPITNVFGSIPCRFQGGRIPPRDAGLEDALKILKEYDNRGVGCRLTFSNSFIEEGDLGDDLSNKLLEYLNSLEGAKHGVIVTSDRLTSYIREKYSNLELIASQVKPSVEVGLGNDTVDYYNNLIDKYDVVVVNPSKINDVVFLQGLKDQNKVEFIANHRCVPNCPRCKRHYELQMILSNKLLNGEGAADIVKELAELVKECTEVKKENPLAGNQMSYSDIEYLGRMGFNKFKIEGRDNDGICFIRDVGEYIFNYQLYDRVATSIMGGAV